MISTYLLPEKDAGTCAPHHHVVPSGATIGCKSWMSVYTPNVDVTMGQNFWVAPLASPHNEKEGISHMWQYKFLYKLKHNITLLKAQLSHRYFIYFSRLISVSFEGIVEITRLWMLNRWWYWLRVSTPIYAAAASQLHWLIIFFWVISLYFRHYDIINILQDISFPFCYWHYLTLFDDFSIRA